MFLTRTVHLCQLNKECQSSETSKEPTVSPPVILTNQQSQMSLSRYSYFMISRNLKQV
ncbi:hypothetical protein J6590_029771 [Homalodisca vitripennis]|nr:hypothetical protein J6590_029771 [Homalodisca vitripennis]